VPIPRWSDGDPTAPGLITHTRTWRRGEIAEAVRARLDAWRRPPLVAIVGAATPEHLLDLLAAIDGGVPALMLHPRWTERETDAMLARAAPTLVIEGGLVTRELRSARDSLKGTLAIVPTSGTTGAPKLAVLSRRAFVASARASAFHLDTSTEDRWLLAMPLAHVGGLGVVVRSLVGRTPIVLHQGGGNPMSWLALARTAEVTHVSLVPTSLARLLDGDEPIPRSIRVMLVGGAACPKSVLERAITRDYPVRPTYGLTETCGQVATATHDPRALALLPGVQVRIEQGTIRVKSPAAMDGWLDAESPFDEDGFYDTGDLGELHDGCLSIHARRTDLVVTGGENVYPREVEDTLERIDGVRAACVFGVPDLVWGQRVAVAIVTDAGAPADDQILVRARAELASFKVPRLVARLDALELNASGKIDRARTAARSLPFLRVV